MTDRIRHAATVAMLLLAAGTVGCQSFDVVGAKETLPDGDMLWIRSESGLRAPEPWYIKLLEELPEWSPGRPWENVLDLIESRYSEGR